MIGFFVISRISSTKQKRPIVPKPRDKPQRPVVPKPRDEPQRPIVPKPRDEPQRPFVPFFYHLKIIIMKHLKSIILTTLTLLSCGSNHKPRPSFVENLLSEHITQRSKGKIKLIDFQKTDGKDNTIAFDGHVLDSSYEFMYAATIEYLEDGYPQSPSPRERDFILEEKLGFLHKTKVSKGETSDISGSIILEKTEKTWLPRKDIFERIVNIQGGEY